MKIFITGASGFIGNNLISSLVKRNEFELGVLVRRETELAGKNPRVKVIKNDIEKLTKDELEIIANYDLVVHLAWDFLPYYNKVEHLTVELPKHIQFISELINLKLKRIIVSGSCLEYGKREGKIIPESQTSPNTFYGLAKDSLRKYLELAKIDNKFEFQWLRFFYIYGEGQKNYTLYGSLQSAINIKAKQFEMSHGEQERDYIEINELIDKIIKVIQEPNGKQIQNCCSGRPTKVVEVVEDLLLRNKYTLELVKGKKEVPKYEGNAFWGGE
jgi:dTDP-6-deoxy-L-talose 4-dehydrogenase (NAD+)